jgi:RIO-like serine/threonine protein kinase
MRDIKNINRYFRKYTNVQDEVELFKRIVGEKRLVP